MLLKRGIPEIN